MMNFHVVHVLLVLLLSSFQELEGSSCAYSWQCERSNSLTERNTSQYFVLRRDKASYVAPNSPAKSNQVQAIECVTEKDPMTGSLSCVTYKEHRHCLDDRIYWENLARNSSIANCTSNTASQLGCPPNPDHFSCETQQGLRIYKDNHYWVDKQKNTFRLVPSPDVLKHHRLLEHHRRLTGMDVVPKLDKTGLGSGPMFTMHGKGVAGQDPIEGYHRTRHHVLFHEPVAFDREMRIDYSEEDWLRHGMHLGVDASISLRLWLWDMQFTKSSLPERTVFMYNPRPSNAEQLWKKSWVKSHLNIGLMMGVLPNRDKPYILIGTGPPTAKRKVQGNHLPDRLEPRRWYHIVMQMQTERLTVKVNGVVKLRLNVKRSAESAPLSLLRLQPRSSYVFIAHEGKYCADETKNKISTKYGLSIEKCKDQCGATHNCVSASFVYQVGQSRQNLARRCVMWKSCSITDANPTMATTLYLREPAFKTGVPAIYPMPQAELPMRLSVGSASGYKAPPMLLQEVWVSEKQFEIGTEPERVCDTRGVCDALDDDQPPNDYAVNLIDLPPALALIANGVEALATNAVKKSRRLTTQRRLDKKIKPKPRRAKNQTNPVADNDSSKAIANLPAIGTNEDKKASDTKATSPKPILNKADASLESSSPKPNATSDATKLAHPETFPTMFDVGMWLSSMSIGDRDLLPMVPATVVKNGIDLCSMPINVLVNTTNMSESAADRMKPPQALAALWQEGICRQKDVQSALSELAAVDHGLLNLRTAVDTVNVAWWNQTVLERAKVTKKTYPVSKDGIIVNLRGCILYYKLKAWWSYMLCRKADGSQREGLWQLRFKQPAADAHALDPSRPNTAQLNQLTLIGRLGQRPTPTSDTDNQEHSTNSLVHHYLNGENCQRQAGKPHLDVARSGKVSYVCCEDDGGYRVKYTKKWPNCKNIVPKGHRGYFFNQKSLAAVKQTCDQETRCTGFSWHKGNGCWKDCSSGEKHGGYSFGKHDFYEALSYAKQRHLRNGNLYFHADSPLWIDSVVEPRPCTYELRVCVPLLCRRQKLSAPSSSAKTLSSNISQSFSGAKTSQKSFQFSHMAYLLAVVGGQMPRGDEIYKVPDTLDVANVNDTIKEFRRTTQKQRRELLGHRYGSVFNRDSRPEQDYSSPPESERMLELGRIAATMALAYRTHYGHTRADGPHDTIGLISNRNLEKYNLMASVVPTSQGSTGDRRLSTAQGSSVEMSENKMQPNCPVAAAYLRVAAKDANSHWKRHAPQREPGVFFSAEPNLDRWRGLDGEEAQYNEQRAQQGDPASVTWIAHNYYRGRAGYPQDRQLARENFQRAADMGHADAQYNLGVMEANGDGFPADQPAPNNAERMRRANEWFQLAAEQDFNPALNGLGRINMQGSAAANVTRNVTKAFEWFKRASDKGSLDGHHNVAMAFLRGGFNSSVFLEDEKRAEEASGKPNNPWAQYYNGSHSHAVRARPFRLLPPNVPLAIKYLTLATNGGHARSLEALGKEYTSPVGVLAQHHAMYLERKKNATGGENNSTGDADAAEDDFDRIEFSVILRDSGYRRLYNMTVPLKPDCELGVRYLRRLAERGEVTKVMEAAIYEHLAAKDAEDEEDLASLVDGDASTDSTPTAWQNMLSKYSSTVSKVKTVVHDALALVKSGAGGGEESKTKETSEETAVAESVDQAGYLDASAMRRHERVLELLHAGSEMGYPLAMVNEGWMLLRQHKRQHDETTGMAKVDTAWSPLDAIHRLLESTRKVADSTAIDLPRSENLSEKQMAQNLDAVQTAMRLFARAARRGQLDAVQLMGDVMLHGLQNASVFHPLLRELPKLRHTDHDRDLRRYRVNTTAAYRYFLAARYHGSDEGRFKLAWMHLNGHGPPVDASSTELVVSNSPGDTAVDAATQDDTEGKDKDQHANQRQRQFEAARALLRECAGKGKIPAHVLLFALDYMRPVLAPVLRALQSNVGTTPGSSEGLQRLGEYVGYDSSLWSFIKLMLIEDGEGQVDPEVNHDEHSESVIDSSN